MPEKTLERLCGRIKASLWRGRTRTVIVERPPQKPAGPHGVPLSHMSEYLKNKIRSLPKTLFGAIAAHRSAHVEVITRT